MNWVKRVQIIDVTPRDGLQDAHGEIPTKQKVQLVQELFAAGVAKVEATSFVSPKWIPKLADAESLMSKLPDTANTIALVPNFKGYQRAKQAGIGAITFVVSASPRHQLDNLRMSLEKSIEEMRHVAEVATVDGIEVRGAISCSFGTPYDGEVIQPAEVAWIAKEMAAFGAAEISLADTVGIGTPQFVSQVLEAVRNELPSISLSMHLHDRYGLALGNVVVALERGISTFETALGGLGGCPYAPEAPGNLDTETFVRWMQDMGIETGTDLPLLASTRVWLLKELAAAE